MKLTNPEKLIVNMLCEIHEKLAITNGIDPAFVRDAIFTDNTWALIWQYPGIFDSSTEETPKRVRDVGNILDMWDRIEFAVDQLGDDGVKALEDATGGAPVRFAGFDGNNETEWLSAAGFLVGKMDRFQRFAKHGMNSHFPTVGAYLRMYAVYEPIRANLMNRSLSRDELVAILKARAA